MATYDPWGKTIGYERGEAALRRFVDKVFRWLPKRWEAAEMPRGKAADEHKAFDVKCMLAGNRIKIQGQIDTYIDILVVRKYI